MQEDRLIEHETGSIIVIIATDLPMRPDLLSRLARRAGLGIGRAGTPGGNNSGDIFLAFSTANARGADSATGTLGHADFIPDTEIDPFFDAVIQATEEAILNAIVANDDMAGINGNFVPALPKAWLEQRYGKA